MRKVVKKDYTPKYFPPKPKVMVAPKVYPDKKIIGGVAFYELTEPESVNRKYINAKKYESRYGVPKPKRKYKKPIQ